MLKHYILSTLRHLWRRKLYSTITLLSLTIGLSVFSLIFLHVKWEFSYNNGFKDSGLIYRLIYDRDQTGTFTEHIFSNEAQGISGFLEDLVQAATTVTRANVKIGEGEEFVIGFTDSAYPLVFEPEVVKGDLSRTFEEPGRIALEESVALSMLGSVDVIGETITLDSATRVTTASFDGSSPVVNVGESQDFMVTAVYTLPQPLTTGLQYKALTYSSEYAYRLLPENLNPENGFSTELVWLKLLDRSSVEQINRVLVDFVDQSNFLTRNRPAEDQTWSDLVTMVVEPMNGIYFNSQTRTGDAGNLARVVSFSVIGLLVLIAGCTNAISLGLASGLERSREIGVRKSVGASRRNLIIQFLGEPLALSLVALIPVLLITGVFHPVVADMLSFPELPSLVPGDYALLASIVIVVGLTIGSYPALVLSRLKPVSILRPQASQKAAGAFNFRSVLVGLQFSFSCLILVVTLGLYIQLMITRSQPLGFDPEHLVLVSHDPNSSTASLEAIVNGLENSAGITSVLVRGMPPMHERQGPENTMSRFPDDNTVPVFISTIEAGFFSLIGTRLLAGREFDLNRDQTEYLAPRVVINETALNGLGFESPEAAIGQSIYMQSSYPGSASANEVIEILGVVENSRYQGLRNRQIAQVYRFTGESIFRAAQDRFLLRINPAANNSVQQQISQSWLTLTGTEPVNIIYAEEVVDTAFAEEQREGNLLLVCGAMTLLLSCTGLYGLAAISMKTRTKEIGVRKVLGASRFTIINTVLAKFTLPVISANLLAWPLAAYFVLQWIERFPYQLEKYWLLPICLGTSLLVLLIAWITVSALTYKTASAKLVLALRYE